MVGTSNAFTAGFGNAGGGITYFLMPAIYDSLVKSQHLSPHVAWRVAFIVPFICIVTVALALLLLCPDTPTGKWRDRHIHVQRNLASHGIQERIVEAPSGVMEKKPVEGNEKSADGAESPPTRTGSQEKIQYEAGPRKASNDHEAQLGEQQMLDTARGEVVVKPTMDEAIKVVFSLQTLVTAGCYFCSFGAELAINSILGSYYLQNFKELGQTGSGRWAAMFGLLNVVFRPIGGLVSDFVYRKTGSVWSKKLWLHFLSIIMGAFEIAIGVTNPHKKSTMFGLIAGMAFFLEGSNGANYSLVPHVHPHANGKSHPHPSSHHHLSRH